MTTAALREVDIPRPRHNWPSYPNYEPTGVAWLVQMPSHWSIKRLRYVVTFPTKGEVRGLRLDTSVSFIPMEAVGEFGGLALDQTRPLEEVLNGYTYFRNDDVVVAKITPCFENGKGALANGLENGIGFGTTELHVLRAGTEILPRFLIYLTLGEHFRKLGAAEMYGAGGQKRVPERFLRDLRHPIPSLLEQEAISAFLDRETAKIDELIEKKRQLISRLAAKRAAVITKAVTKGLNESVKLKSSGFEWLGDVPEHWHVLSYKRLCTRVDVGIAEAATHAYCDDGVPIIRSTNVKKNSLDTSDILRIESWFAEKNRSKMLHGGDLVTVRTGYPGTTAVIPEELDGCQCFTLVMSSPKRNVHGPYFSWVMNSPPGEAYFAMESWGSAQANISVPIVQFMPVPCPPLNEQIAISNYLQLETMRFDALSAKVERANVALAQYRSVLITAAVTGQIDVRENRREARCQ